MPPQAGIRALDRLRVGFFDVLRARFQPLRSVERRASAFGGSVMTTWSRIEERTSSDGRSLDRLPRLLNVDEAADLLRTSRRAIYAMIARRQLPGVVRIRRRVLLRADDLLDWLDQKRAPSLKE
jgi:excisionase family DNA binding protein